MFKMNHIFLIPGEHEVLGSSFLGVRRSTEGEGTDDQNIRCKSLDFSLIILTPSLHCVFPVLLFFFNYAT